MATRNHTYTVKWIGDAGSDDCSAASLAEAKSMMRRKWKKYSAGGMLRCVAYKDGDFLGGFWLRY